MWVAQQVPLSWMELQNLTLWGQGAENGCSSALCQFSAHKLRSLFLCPHTRVHSEMREDIFIVP